MNIRWNTLWRVPVFCVIASWVSFMIMVYMGGFFYADPVRSAIFDGAVFLIILLIGGAAVLPFHDQGGNCRLRRDHLLHLPGSGPGAAVCAGFSGITQRHVGQISELDVDCGCCAG